MKRLIALFLTLMMLLTLALPADAAVEYEEVTALGALGLYDDIIDPAALARPITRGEGTALLLRLIGGQHAVMGANRHPFTDVPADLDDAVAWAYTEGLTRGVSETAFAPDAPMTREMYLTMLFRALGYRDGVDFTWSAAERLIDWAGLYTEPDDGELTLHDALKLTWWALRCVPVDQEVTDGTWLRLIARAAGKITATQAEAVACLDGYILGLGMRVTDPWGRTVPAAISLKETGIGGAFTDPVTEQIELSLTFDGEPLALPSGTLGLACRMPGLWSVYHCTYVPLTATLEALGFTLSYDARTNTLTGTTAHGEIAPQTGAPTEASDAELPILYFCQPETRIVLDGRTVDLEHYRTLKADGTTLYEEALLILSGGEYYIPLDLLADTLGLGTDGGSHLFSERLTKFTYPNNSAVFRSADGQYVLLWGGETLSFSGLPGAEVVRFDWHDERGSGVFDTLRMQLADESGRLETHVIDLLAMKHISSTLYDYVELAVQPAWGITLRGVVAPHWGETGQVMYCNHFALTVGDRTVWFQENALMLRALKQGGGVSLAMRDEGRTVEISLCTQMRADGKPEDLRVIAFDCETLERLY